MTGIEEAARGLDAALERLEHCAASRAAAQLQRAKDAAAIAALSQERERLLARIAELEAGSRSLASITEEVEDRLDGAIAEIRATLGH